MGFDLFTRINLIYTDSLAKHFNRVSCMRIDIAGQAVPITTPTPASVMDSWRVGQILNAIVISTDVRGVVTLNVNETLIQAHIQSQPHHPLPTPAGQSLQLQVTSTGTQTVLKVINPPAQDDPITQALRTALPRQAELTPLLTNIALLADPAANKASAPLPQHVVQLAQQLFNNLTSTVQASTASGLQHAVNNSGVFLENRLANTVIGHTDQHLLPLSLDFKAGLLLLREALATPTPLKQPQDTQQALRNTVPESPASRNIPGQPAPGTPVTTGFSAAALAPISEAIIPMLTTQLEGALARLHVNQLASLASPQQPLWVIELPLRHDNHIDLLQLRIEQDGGSHTPDTQERPWTISLALELGDLGPLYARITLLGQQVSVTLWAENNATALLANHNIEQLQHGLVQAGINTGTLHCQQGNPPHIPQRDTHLTGARSLLDTHA